MAELRRIAVIGASLAGLRAVEALRARGFDGRIDWIGAEAARTLRPPAALEAGVARRVGTGTHRTGARRSRGIFRRAALRPPRDPARRRARRVALDDGAELAFDGLVIATGASPRMLPGQPDLDGVFTLRTVDDALAIRAALAAEPRVVVVGGGFIGAEVAASCRARGARVAMIEALGNPLEQALGPELGALYAAIHRDHGVDVRTGVAVAAIEGAKVASSACGSRTASCCRRISSSSASACDPKRRGSKDPESRWRTASCATPTCATNAPDIVAAGDVARWTNPRYGESMRVEHWTNAVEQAQAAVARLLDGPEAAKPFDPVPFVWSDQYDTKLAVAGRPRAGDDMRVVDGSFAERKFVAIYGREGRLSGAVAMNRMRKHLDWRRALHEGISFEEALVRAGA